MPFTKNDPNINTAGRPKGSKNKNTILRMVQVRDLTTELYERLKDDIDELTPAQRADLFIKLVSFQIPKIKPEKYRDHKKWRPMGESYLDDFDT